MSEPVLSPDTLPRAHVLSYITTVSTPTRVRIIAARVTLISGLLNVLIVVCLIVGASREVYRGAVVRAAPGLVFFGGVALPPAPRPVELRDFIASSGDYMGRHPWWLGLLIFVMGGAIVLPMAAPAIRRGRRALSLLALFYFSIAAVIVGCLGVLVICYYFAVQFTRYPRWHDWWALWWLLLIPVAAIPPVLLKDVCAFLLWIIRHPIAEKPPVPFLPAGVSM